MKHFARHACAAIGLAAMCAPLGAQSMDYGSTYYMPNTMINMSEVHAYDVDEQVEEVIARPEAEAASSAGLGYTSTSARTRANLAHFAAQARAVSPAAAADLERMFDAIDVVGEAGKAMTGLGLDPHNVADAYAIWWIQAWANAHMREAPSDAATFQAVSRQARAAFADTQGFAALPDADKQRFAEALMVQAVMLGSAFDAAAGDANLKRRLAGAAKQGASGMGLDLATMTLTPQGFRPRKGAAVDDTAMPGAAGEERLAAATTGNADGGSIATYAAVAAAASAGLGAAYWLGRGGRSG